MSIPLIEPDKFFEEHEDVNFFVSLTIVALAGIVGAIVVYLTLPMIEENVIRVLVQHNVPVDKAEKFFEFMKFYLILSPLIGSFIAWILLSGLIQIFSALMGGEGEFSKTLKFVAFGFLPGIILAPMSYAVITMTHDLTSLPVKIVGLASTVWQFYILTFAVKHARKLSTIKAAVCVILAICVSFLLRFAGNLFRPS